MIWPFQPVCAGLKGSMGSAASNCQCPPRGSRYVASTEPPSSSTCRVSSSTDAGGVPNFTTANDITIKIPAAFPMEWNTALQRRKRQLRLAYGE